MYKFLRLIGNKIVSGYNNDFVWEIGKSYKVKGKLSMCNNGFHCSEKPLDALGYVAGEILAEVKTVGKSIIENDKQCWQEMKIVKAYSWTKKDSVALSIFAAELVLDIFEKQYPDDDRPRKAIEAAKKVLKNDNEKNRSAARSARSAARSAESAARSAWSAARSAWSAAESAESAARSAWSAARSAWSAAWSAARSAESAARSAAIEEINNKINAWIINHTKKLKSITH
jgi:hypothetical protein